MKENFNYETSRRVIWHIFFRYLGRLGCIWVEEEYTPETLDKLYNLLLEYQENEKDAYLDYEYEELSRRIDDCLDVAHLPDECIREILLDFAEQYNHEK